MLKHVGAAEKRLLVILVLRLVTRNSILLRTAAKETVLVILVLNANWSCMMPFTVDNLWLFKMHIKILAA